MERSVDFMTDEEVLAEANTVFFYDNLDSEDFITDPDVARRMLQDYYDAIDNPEEAALDYDLYKKGGEIGRNVHIVNEGVEFNRSKYPAIFGDFDSDGNANIDDAYPLDSNRKGQVEPVRLEKTFQYLLDVKDELDKVMHSAIDKIDDKAPVTADVYARTKTPYSIVKKLVEKRMLDPKRGLQDLIGTTIAVNTHKQLEELRDKIKDGLLGNVMDYDDYYKSPKAGYMAHHFIVRYKDVPVEIQLKTKAMKKLHEISHEFYKEGTLNPAGTLRMSKLIMKADKGDKKAKKEVSEIFSDQSKIRSILSNKKKAGGILSPAEEKDIDIYDMVYAKGGLTPSKAKEILEDGTAHGKPLTEKQRRYMYTVSRGTNKKEMGGKINEDIRGTIFADSWETILDEIKQKYVWGKHISHEKDCTLKADRFGCNHYFFSAHRDIGGRVYNLNQLRKVLKDEYGIESGFGKLSGWKNGLKVQGDQLVGMQLYEQGGTVENVLEGYPYVVVVDGKQVSGWDYYNDAIKDGIFEGQLIADLDIEDEYYIEIPFFGDEAMSLDEIGDVYIDSDEEDRERIIRELYGKYGTGISSKEYSIIVRNKDDYHYDESYEETDDLYYEKGGEVVTEMNYGDPVIYKDRQYYIHVRDGKAGIADLSHGAWGSDYPFFHPDWSKVKTMNGKPISKNLKVRGASKFAKGGEVSKKKDLKTEQDSYHTLKKYFITFHTDTTSDEYSNFNPFDEDDARSMFDILGVGDYHDGKFSVELSVKEDSYRHIGGEDFPSEDYPVEDYYDDEDIYELIEEGELDTIEYKDIEAVNQSSDDLLEQVEDWARSEYGNSWSGYWNVDIDDDGSCIQLRIKDHSANPANRSKSYCGRLLSVVIANKNATTRWVGHNANELYFDSDDDFEYVTSSIKDELEHLENWLTDSSYAKGGEIDYKAQEYIDMLDALNYDPRYPEKKPRMKKYADILLNEYNIEYMPEKIRYAEDIETLKQYVGTSQAVTSKGLPLTIDAYLNSNLARTLQVDAYLGDNLVGRAGFSIDSKIGQLRVGGAIVNGDYRRQGVYRSLVDFMAKVADENNLKFYRYGRSSDAQAFWESYDPSGSMQYAKGGEVIGKSHAEGGEKFTVGGRVVELEGGEGVINKKNMADKKTYTVTGTPKEIASCINEIDGNGVKFRDGGGSCNIEEE